MHIDKRARVSISKLLSLYRIWTESTDRTLPPPPPIFSAYVSIRSKTRGHSVYKVEEKKILKALGGTNVDVDVYLISRIYRAQISNYSFSLFPDEYVVDQVALVEIN